MRTLLGLALALAVVSCGGPSLGRHAVLGSSPTASPETHEQPPPEPPRVTTGTYINGGSGTPHYFVLLTVSGDGLTGTLGFVFQDGQTGEALTFKGQQQAGVIRMIFSDRSTATATVDSEGGFEIGECHKWMPRVQARNDCDFRQAASINP